MGTHNICLHKEVDKKYTGCNLKTTELLDSALVGACAVIRLNMVYALLAKGSSTSSVKYHSKTQMIPRPLVIFSQSDYLMQTVDLNSHT